ncbi:hypothetical protein ACFLTD_03935, partial [Elusimicrobiota bacterium]
MEFRKSVTISTVIHVAVILLLPQFRFANIQTDWVEVSMIAIPDIKQKMPDWQPGRRSIPLPSKEVLELPKDRLPMPSDIRDAGIPVRSETPQQPPIAEKLDYTRELEDDFEKVVPGRKERKGLLEELGEDKSMVIAG